MDTLGIIETFNAEMKTLKEVAELGGSMFFERDREARVEVPKPPIFKSAHDAEEV